ncbi:MAG TPA: septum formation initiator family protein [Acidimicrobiales bacterium]|nr:septum formation initiator family protein [Acidimicrobiales bacterium]
MRRHRWFVASLLALLGVLVLGSFPARAYLDQVGQRDDLAERVAALAVENARLADQAAYLGTDEAVERLARERYHLVRPGEEAYAILPTGAAAEPAASGPQPAAAAGPASGPPPALAPVEQSLWSQVWSKLTSIL